MNREWLKKEFGTFEGVSKMEISPREAERWLNNNTHNRRISEKKVEHLQLMMIRGMWVDSPDGIMFDENGVIMNGQHRLMALALLADSQPDIKISSLVIWGTPKKNKNGYSAMAFIDRVRVRTGGQNWGLTHGYQLSPHYKERIASLINFLGKVFSGGIRQTLEEPEIDLIYKLYKDEIRIVVREGCEAVRLSRAPVMAALVFAAKIDPEKVLEFENHFFSGENLSAGSPILRLREKILTGHDNEVRARVSLFKITLTAIKYFVEGELLTKLYVTDKGVDYFWFGQRDVIQKIQQYIKISETDKIESYKDEIKK